MKGETHISLYYFFSWKISNIQKIINSIVMSKEHVAITQKEERFMFFLFALGFF